MTLACLFAATKLARGMCEWCCGPLCDQPGKSPRDFLKQAETRRWRHGMDWRATGGGVAPLSYTMTQPATCHLAAVRSLVDVPSSTPSAYPRLRQVINSTRNRILLRFSVWLLQNSQAQHSTVLPTGSVQISNQVRQSTAQNKQQDSSCLRNAQGLHQLSHWNSHSPAPLL